MFSRWDLKFVKQDLDKIVWKRGNIHILGRIGLEEDRSELAQFLRNMSLTDAQMTDLLIKVEEAVEDVEQVARRWMLDQADIIDAWLPK